MRFNRRLSFLLCTLIHSQLHTCTHTHTNRHLVAHLLRSTQSPDRQNRSKCPRATHSRENERKNVHQQIIQFDRVALIKRTAIVDRMACTFNDISCQRFLSTFASSSRLSWSVRKNSNAPFIFHTFFNCLTIRLIE